MVYTPTLSEDFFTLAREVDQLIEKHPTLEWSFVQVSDPKGAQYGGYTAEELKTRLDEINALVKKHKLKHLSFLVSAPPARAGDTTVTLALAQRDTTNSKRTVVVWTMQMDGTKLDKATIKKLISELSVTIGK
ncbi:hypothetical protein [Armatimonas sp.]|uniref:hypothetical protein n=1 Tax=Armatimonas sp. TaxID=1872638 RepID=UPI00286B7F4E|nr:hypothetical protein [Armatimonas sp.]